MYNRTITFIGFFFLIILLGCKEKAINILDTKSKNIIISRIKRDKQEKIVWSDTTKIIYDNNKIISVSSTSEKSELKFEYLNDVIKCTDNDSNYALKFNSKGYASEYTYEGQNTKYVGTFVYDKDDYLIEIIEKPISGWILGTNIFSIYNQNLVKYNYSSSILANSYNFETSNIENNLSNDILLYIINATIDEPKYFYHSFIYFFNTKPFKL